MAYMAMVNTRDSIQGMVKIWETAIRHSKQLRRKQWFLKWLKHPRRQDVVHRPAGPLLWTDISKLGFFILLR